MVGEILQNKGIEINKELSADEKTAIEGLDLSNNAKVKNALLTEKIKIDINADGAIASDNSEGKTMQEIMTEFNDNVEVNPTDATKLSIIADKDSTAPEWIKKIVDSEGNRGADLAFLITTINKTFLNESILTPQETFDVQTKTELGNLKNEIEKVDASADVLQESELNFTLYNGVNLADIVKEVNKITDTNDLKSDLIALLKTPDIVGFQKALGMAEGTGPEDADGKFGPYTLSVLEKKNDPNVNLYSYDNTNDSNNNTESDSTQFLSLEDAEKDPTANHMHIDGKDYVPNAGYTWVDGDENNGNRKTRLMTKEECLNELDKNHLIKDNENTLLPADGYDWEDKDNALNYAVVELPKAKETIKSSKEIETINEKDKQKGREIIKKYIEDKDIDFNNVNQGLLSGEDPSRNLFSDEVNKIFNDAGIIVDQNLTNKLFQFLKDHDEIDSNNNIDYGGSSTKNRSKNNQHIENLIYDNIQTIIHY